MAEKTKTMHRLSKSKLYEHLVAERRLVAAIRDKLNALANAQLKQDRQLGKNKDKVGNEYTSAVRKRTKPKSISHLKNEIHLFLASVNIHPHFPEKEVPLASREESWLIRLDWDGQFRKPADTDYSEAYVQARQIAGEQRNQADGAAVHFPSQYLPQDYHLEHSPIWQFMRRFDSYAANRRHICEQLSVQNIPPTVVRSMNFFDFSEVLYNWSKSRQKRPFEPARSRNFKMFEACYGEDFARIMTMLRYKPEYIAEVREKMRRGSCDGIITADNTPEDLNNSRPKNGHDGCDGMFNFHHKINVSRFKELDEPQSINDFSNMLLTFVHPHHRVLHFGQGYDVPSDLVFFGGYDKLYQIKRNPERERQYLQSKTLTAAANAKRSR